MSEPDELYVMARRVLLDALEALGAHRDAIVLVGAQAVYLRVGEADLAVAPFTTDGDLAIDPAVLAAIPPLEEALLAAGFLPKSRDSVGVWITKRQTSRSVDAEVAIDLLVPASVSPGAGRRAARLPGHDSRAARIVRGLDGAMQQLMLPLLLAMDATKKGLLSFVQQMGMVALSELLATEAAMIAGPKGRHIEGRTHHHWGTATTPVGFGGRHVSLTYPRVRVRGKGRGADGLRPATQKAARKKVRPLVTRLACGEKRNRKRMAEVAAVYTVPLFVRTPFDVLTDLHSEPDEQARRQRRARRPKVRHKRVWASVAHDTEAVIDEAFREAHARDPEHRRTWVVLLDGNKDQLALVKAAAKKLGVEVTIVVDLMHMLEYLWKAAHALHDSDVAQAEEWVQQRLMWLLQGRRAGQVATAVRQAARAAHLRGSKLATVRNTADYLQQYAPYMRYGNAIERGLPIATGVIEGACRYLVKDRMDRGGARWTLAGAEAVLRLRALRASGDFDAYWTLHLREELRRNHAERYADGRLPDPLRPLRRVK